MEYGGASARVSSDDLVDFLVEAQNFKTTKATNGNGGSDLKTATAVLFGYNVDDADWL